MCAAEPSLGNADTLATFIVEPSSFLLSLGFSRKSGVTAWVSVRNARDSGERVRTDCVGRFRRNFFSHRKIGKNGQLFLFVLG